MKRNRSTSGLGAMTYSWNSIMQLGNGWKWVFLVILIGKLCIIIINIHPSEYWLSFSCWLLGDSSGRAARSDQFEEHLLQLCQTSREPWWYIWGSYLVCLGVWPFLIHNAIAVSLKITHHSIQLDEIPGICVIWNSTGKQIFLAISLSKFY